MLSGEGRPYHFTNQWSSDPNQVMPQWCAREWDSLQLIGATDVRFPGNMLREYWAYGPFYRDPQCPKDYVVEVCLEGEWRSVVKVSGNYQRFRRHQFTALMTTKLRIVVFATNGDPRAAIYDIRCYAE